MFEYLTGKIISCTSGKLVLEVAGVGFAIKVPLTTEISLTPGENSKIFINSIIREDSIRLFGFKTIEERELFEKLQSVSGVGPALAMMILSGGSPLQLREAILSENIAFFKGIKGVGPKTAKRIILELKGVIPQIATSSVVTLDIAGQALHQDAISALMALGYPNPLASEAVGKTLQRLGEQVSLDDLIRESLKEM